MRTFYVRTLRERRGWTQEDLAARSDVAQNTISKIESGFTRQPAFRIIVALARAFRVNPLQLRFGPDPNRPARRAVRGPGKARMLA